MNFVINVSGSRVIGEIDELAYRTSDPVDDDAIWGADLHYLEHRNDPNTGEQFVALVYRVPHQEGQ